MRKKTKIELVWEVNKDGTVKVLCYFLMKDRTRESRYLPVDRVKFHEVLVLDPVTREPIGETIFIDEGYIRLPDKQEMYYAKGTPPLVYRENDCTEVRWT